MLNNSVMSSLPMRMYASILCGNEVPWGVLKKIDIVHQGLFTKH